ncbi:MAG: hypothetical protein C3F07_16615 [Anaerolineales bacterium]|nr:MAG: hypothetical protein C3F07_16615 [Anaerolineales bacterium]
MTTPPLKVTSSTVLTVLSTISSGLSTISSIYSVAVAVGSGISVGDSVGVRVNVGAVVGVTGASVAATGAETEHAFKIKTKKNKMNFFIISSITVAFHVVVIF